MELTHERLNRNLFTLSWPAVLENLLHTTVFIVDTLMVSALGTNALAAVGLSGTLLWITSSIFSVVMVGATALVARYIGAKDLDQARIATGDSLMITGLLGVLLTLGGILLARDVLILMGAEKDVIHLGSIYLRIVFTSISFRLFIFVGSGILRGTGDTRTPMIITLIANSLNVLCNYLLIFGKFGLPRLEVTGAALATALSFIMGASLTLFVLFTGRSFRSLRLNRTEPLLFLKNLFGFHMPMWGKILRISIPSGIQQGIMGAGMIIFTKIVTSLGTQSLAAHQIVVRIEALSFMPVFGLSTALSTLVGQSLGAKEVILAEKSVRRALRFSILLMFLFAFFFVSIPHFFVKFFNPDEKVLVLASLCILIAAFEQLPFGLVLIYEGGLKGAGETRGPMLVTFLGGIGIRLPFAYLLGITLGWGLVGIWIAITIDWTVRLGVIYGLFRRGKWKQVKV
jgi:putative MATE family efflux protein